MHCSLLLNNECRIFLIFKIELEQVVDSLETMRIFIAVVEQRGFSKAAAVKGLPKATVSTAIQRLETRLNTQLLHRTTRQVALTTDGEVFYQRCLDLVSEADDMYGMFLQKTNISGKIRVGLPLRLASMFLFPKLSEFLSSHPDIDVEVSTTDRYADIVSEGIDCVIRVGTLADSNLIAKPLGELHLITCASPDYIEQYGMPTSLYDLQQHYLVSYSPTLNTKNDTWEYMVGSKVREVSLSSRVTVDNTEAYLQACLNGFGLIQVPFASVHHLLSSGQLVRVMAEFNTEPMPVSLLYAQRQNVPRRVRVFMEWLSDNIDVYLKELQAAF